MKITAHLSVPERLRHIRMEMERRESDVDDLLKSVRDLRDAARTSALIGGHAWLCALIDRCSDTASEVRSARAVIDELDSVEREIAPKR